MPLNPIYATYNWQEAPPGSPYKFCPLCATPLALATISHLPRAHCANCGFIHFHNPAPGVAVFVVDSGRVLLGLRRGPLGGGKWALPSGYIEFHEDYLTVGRREVKEETGLDVRVTAVIHVESAFLGPTWHFFTVYLLAHPTGGTLHAGDDAEAVAWFPLTGPLPDMAFTPDITIIEQYASGALALLPLDG